MRDRGEGREVQENVFVHRPRLPVCLVDLEVLQLRQLAREHHRHRRQVRDGQSFVERFASYDEQVPHAFREPGLLLEHLGACFRVHVAEQPDLSQ